MFGACVGPGLMHAFRVHGFVPHSLFSALMCRCFHIEVEAGSEKSKEEHRLECNKMQDAVLASLRVQMDHWMSAPTHESISQASQVLHQASMGDLLAWENVTIHESVECVMCVLDCTTSRTSLWLCTSTCREKADSVDIKKVAKVFASVCKRSLTGNTTRVVKGLLLGCNMHFFASAWRRAAQDVGMSSADMNRVHLMYTCYEFPTGYVTIPLMTLSHLRRDTALDSHAVETKQRLVEWQHDFDRHSIIDDNIAQGPPLADRLVWNTLARVPLL